MTREELLRALESCILAPVDRVARARSAAQCIRAYGSYRWVGVYDVTEDEIRLVDHSGTDKPAYPVFSRNLGLSGEAVRTKRPIVVGDVREDPRYLTAFGTTRSEMIVPVLDAGGAVIGTLDVESADRNAFSSDDERMMEAAAGLLLPLFTASGAERST